MSFLLDTNICSYHLRRTSGLAHRFFQYSGRLYISTINLAELRTWAYRSNDSVRVLDRIEQDLLVDVQVLDFDADCADEFAKANAYLLDHGRPTSTADLLIAAVALANNLTLVTHNVADFQSIPGLTIEDWLVP
jgi:tRNA(fMet)-specific endonuclease VapC